MSSDHWSHDPGVRWHSTNLSALSEPTATESTLVPLPLPASGASAACLSTMDASSGSRLSLVGVLPGLMTQPQNDMLAMMLRVLPI